MPKQTIQTGVAANDGTGDSLREGATKVNTNFTEIYNSLGDGSNLKISTTGADTGEVLAYNGTVFVPTLVSGVNSFSTINADTGSAIANTQGDSVNVIGGSGITTQVLDGTLVINAIGGGSGGGASVTVSETPPTIPTDGDLWYDSSVGVLAVWYASQGYWVQTNSAASFNGDITLEGGASTGSSTFLGLSDTPSTFVADYIVKVNAEGTGLEFAEGGGGGNAASAFTPIQLSEDYTAQAYDWIFADTTLDTLTITLPTTSTIGDEIRFLDTTGTFETNNLIVSSSLNIQGDSEDFIVDVNYAGFTLVYVNDTIGWLLKDR